MIDSLSELFAANPASAYTALGVSMTASAAVLAYACRSEIGMLAGKIKGCVQTFKGRKAPEATNDKDDLER